MVRQPNEEKENFEFKLGVLSLKIDLVSYSANGEEVE